jgi:hypothetical protein
MAERATAECRNSAPWPSWRIGSEAISGPSTALKSSQLVGSPVDGDQRGERANAANASDDARPQQGCAARSRPLGRPAATLGLQLGQHC